MSKVITITLSDEKYKEFWAEVGEIVGITVYLDADVTIRDAPVYTFAQLTEPV